MKKYRILLPALLLFLVPGRTNAQNTNPAYQPNWVLPLPGAIVTSAAMPDSSVIFSGIYGSECRLDTTRLWLEPGCSTDGYLARYGYNGRPRWIRRVGGLGTDIIKKILPLPGGDFLIAGDFNSDCYYGGFLLRPYGRFDGMIARLDSNGVARWVNKLGYWGGDDYLTTVSVSGDSLAVVGGSFYGGCYFDSIFVSGSAADHAFVAGIDLTTGRWRWARKTNGLNTDVVNAVFALPDSSIIATGTFKTGVFRIGSGGFQNQGFGTDVWVARLDKHRQWSWARQIGGGADDYVSSVVGLGDGSVILSCMARRTVKFLPGTETRLARNDAPDIFLVKYSRTGRLLWIRQVGGRNHSDWATELELNRDGNISVSGYFSDTTTLAPGLTFTSVGERTGFLARMDTGGRFMTAMLGQATVSGSYAQFSSHTQLSSNQYLVAGSCHTYWGPVNIGTLPYQNNTLGHFITIVKQVDVVTAGKPALLANGLGVYPNPATNRLTVQSAMPLPVPLVLTDAQGKAVLRADPAGASQYSLSLAGLPAGLYRLHCGSMSRKVTLVR